MTLSQFFTMMIAIGAGYTAAQGVEKFPKVQSSMKTIGMSNFVFTWLLHSHLQYMVAYAFTVGKHSFVGMIKAKDWSLARLEELKEKVQKFNEERAAAAAAATATPAH